LIIRRDSPNGKRYARKSGAGEIELAFGFDLSPLVVRSEEFEHLAADIEAEARRSSLCASASRCAARHRQMIATGIEEGVPTRRGGQGRGDWQKEVHAAFRAMLLKIQRGPLPSAARAIADDLFSTRRRRAQSPGGTHQIQESERQ